MKKSILLILASLLLCQCGNQTHDEYRGRIARKLPSDEENEAIRTLNNGEPDLENFTYLRYYNYRFDFSIDYPSFLTPGTPPENGDGLDFAFGKDYEMVVYGGLNAYEITWPEIFESDKKESDTYSVLKDNWYVLSGVDEDGNVYYRKSILHDNIIYTVIFSYPQSRKEAFDSIVKHVLESFAIPEVGVC